MTTYPTASLHPHPEADRVPWADEDAHASLMADIEKHGIQVPVDALPDGTVLDGRTRLAIAKVLQLPEVPVRWVEPADPVGYMLRMALQRRHLTTAQRKALAESLMRLDPGRSDRGIAQETGLSHPTVAAVRADLEASGQLESSTSRTGLDGRTRTMPERAPEPTPTTSARTAASAHPGSAPTAEPATEAVDTGAVAGDADRRKPTDLPTRPPADATRRIARAHLFEALQSARGNADLAHPLSDEDRKQVAVHLDYIRWRCLGDAPILREVRDGS